MIEQPVMLITGSRKGIGRHLVEYYAKLGYIVIGCSRMEFEFSLNNYYHYCLNVSDESAVKNMFKDIRSKFGRLDVLINNAGVASMNHSLLTPLSTVKKIFDTNVIGTFLFCRESVKLFKKMERGRIVNLTTFAVPFKLEGEAVYAASKAAVETLTHILAREYADFNVTVNAIAPPAIQTDLIKGVPSNKLEALLQRQAIHRFGKLDEVCNVVDFLIAEKSDMVTGQVLYMGGL